MKALASAKKWFGFMHSENIFLNDKASSRWSGRPWHILDPKWFVDLTRFAAFQAEGRTRAGSRPSGRARIYHSVTLKADVHLGPKPSQPLSRFMVGASANLPIRSQVRDDCTTA
jgi:hypothetical protein